MECRAAHSYQNDALITALVHQRFSSSRDSTLDVDRAEKEQQYDKVTTRAYNARSVIKFLIIFFLKRKKNQNSLFPRSVRVAERLALPTSDHGVAGSNPAGGEILPEPKRRFIAQSLSCSSFHRLEMTEILLKGRKTLTHPSIVIS